MPGSRRRRARLNGRHLDRVVPARSRIAITSAIALAALACATAGLAAEPARGTTGMLKELSVEELMNLRVTTVSRGESTVRQSAAAVHVITQEDIGRSGATAIPELFRGVPGMDVARIDNNKWAVGVRGFNDRFNGKLLVQVDGRTVYNPLSSGVYWDAVDYPLEDIARIEIIRGPGSSVWGANAVNGIINVITKPAADTHGVLISAGAGTEEFNLGTLRFGAERGSLDYRLYGKAYERDTQFSRSGDSNDDWSGASTGLRLDWNQGARDVLTLQGDLIRSVAERRDFRPAPTVPYSLVNTEDETTDAVNVLGRWERRLDAGSSWALRVYWDRFDREGDNGFVDLRWDTFDADFQHELALGARHKLTYGAGYRYIDAFLGPSRSDNGFAVSFAPADRHPQLFSAFLQDQIELVDDVVSVTLGSKFEHNDFTGFEMQPTARVLWTPTTRQSAWAAVSRGVRTPTLSEDAIGTRQLPSFPPALGGAPLFARLTDSPGFESEELVAYEMGYRAEATAELSVDGAVFYNEYDNLRAVVPGVVMPGSVPGTFEIPLFFQNRMEGDTYGAEVAVTWQPGNRWRLHATYSYLRMDLEADPALPAGVRASAEAPERQNPEQQAYLHCAWSLPQNLELDLTGRYVDRLPGFTPAIEAYTALDARVSWHLGGQAFGARDLEVALIGRNLLDDHHPEFGTAPLLSSLLVEIERSIYAQVKLAW